MSDALDDLFRDSASGSLCFGDIQRHRLQQLLRRHHGRVIWDGASTVTAPATAVFVLNPATAPRLESLVGSLHENSIVVIPSGENPAFDVLKAKLHAYGSIGSQGVAAPHHIWWGGVKPLTAPTGLYNKQDTLFVSSFPRASIVEQKAARLAADLTRLSLDSVIEQTTPDISVPGRRASKADFIIQQWERSGRPVFWIDPDARVHRHPILPQALGCDFAIHKRRSGEIDTGAMFFHQTEPARSLLEIWQRLSRGYPDLPESFLLDQAWTLASSQRQIETAWLPDSYWQVGSSTAWDQSTVIQRDSAATLPGDYLTTRVQAARRFGRHQAPEPHLLMQGPCATRGQITVLIRDVLSGDAQNVSAAVEAVARAFAADSGGFSQMELVLCAWEDDIDSVLTIEDDSWVLVTDPSERLELDAFAKLAHADRKARSARKRSTAPPEADARVVTLADPQLAARLRRHKALPSFVKRPLLSA